MAEDICPTCGLPHPATNPYCFCGKLKEPVPCGGCGQTDHTKRCIGCLHDFGVPGSAWVHKYG